MSVNKKKLLIMIYSMRVGGAERVTVLLLEELQKEYEVHLALFHPKVIYDIPKDVKIHHLASETYTTFDKLKSVILSVKKLKKLSQKLDIDTILVSLNRPILIALLAKLFDNYPKVIVWEHTLQSLWRKEEQIFSYLKFLYLKLSYNYADFIITSSLGIKKDLEQNFGVKEYKVSTIYNPFNLNEILLKAKEKITLPSIGKDTKRIVTAGTLNDIKNHKLLLDAIKVITKDFFVELYILGNGELYTYLLTDIKESKLEDIVKLVGFVENPYSYFTQSDIFVLTSRFEGFGNVIVEAMACGCAIVSTDCPSGPREILAPKNLNSDLLNDYEKAQYGILVPNNNAGILVSALNKLLEDDLLLKSYKKKSLIRARDFDKDIIVEKFLTIFSTLKE